MGLLLVTCIINFDLLIQKVLKGELRPSMLRAAKLFFQLLNYLLDIVITPASAMLTARMSSPELKFLTGISIFLPTVYLIA
tara:strand:- start:361 stop:603 length:243 start_codon:yes stop_codon:yes gene_type:complete